MKRIAKSIRSGSGRCAGCNHVRLGKKVSMYSGKARIFYCFLCIVRGKPTSDNDIPPGRSGML